MLGAGAFDGIDERACCEGLGQIGGAPGLNRGNLVSPGILWR